MEFMGILAEFMAEFMAEIPVPYLAAAAFLYFLPTVIALGRRHHQRAAIAVLDIVFGWTFIGWAVALVWSFTAIRTPPALK